MSTCGVLLAAGAGRRMGRPKALVDGWLHRALDSLSGCEEALVVLGARAEEARALLGGRDVEVVLAQDWDDGMGASLAAGLRRVAQGPATRALVTLVDLPDVGGQVCGRLLEQPDRPEVLARAAYDGVPGHPVLLGRDHWAGVLAVSAGDRGARDYLRAVPPDLVECGDLATGLDVDRPEQQ